MQPIQRLSMDEESSFIAYLYQRHSPALFAYLYRRTPTREDAEDILLEVFTAALEHVTFHTWSESSQIAWLWKVARNKIADAYRRSTRHPSVPLISASDVLSKSTLHSPEQIMLEREEHHVLCAAIQRLPSLQRDVLQLRFEHGLSHSEIARVLQRQAGSVRVLLSRALKQLRSIYPQS